MAFYTPDINHPSVVGEAGSSGVVTASASWQNLHADDLHCTQGVWVKNNDTALYVNVRAAGSANPNGILLSPEEDRFFPVESLHEIQVSSVSGSPVVSWWLK